MNRCDQLALAGVLIVSLWGVEFTRSFVYDLYFGRMPVGTLLVAAAGWVIATYGPVLAATLFWRLAKRFPMPWFVHVLLLPSFYALLAAGNLLMLSTLDVPDFDNTLGAPIMPALFVAIATMLVYFSALAVECVLRSRARSNGR
jgi:hypothetical protein